MITFREQYSACYKNGTNSGRRFDSFKDHPELLPAFPTKHMVAKLKSGEWTGLDAMLCGKFGGDCSSGNEGCVKMRKELEFPDVGAKIKLLPINTAPRDGTYILLFGCSGYTGVKMRAFVGCSYKDSWLNHSNDWCTDSGAEPTHWLPLPDFENL